MSELYPDPDQVEALRAKFAARPWDDAVGYGLGYMHRWTVEAAREHTAECDLSDCETCVNLVRALSLFAAFTIEFPPSADAMKRMYGTE